MKKKSILLATMIALACFNVQAQSETQSETKSTSQTQGILNLLKGLSNKNSAQTDSESTDSTTSKSSIIEGIGNFVVGLLGTDKVSSNSLYGTWNYKQPAITFESENILTNLGGMAASQTVEKKLQTYLDKIGFTAGTLQMTFNEDGSGSLSFKKKNIPFQWSVQDSDLTINVAGSALSKLTSSSKLSKYTSFKINCKVNLTDMQLSFKADKFAQFIQKIISAIGSKSDSATISSVAGIVNKIEGMYLGLTFGK
ncbi:MAG: DUF4923 family protein [Bacteroidaceae bacterium]|nr:DUF4923 family protein [Bacteroidaceae bacterium]